MGLYSLLLKVFIFSVKMLRSFVTPFSCCNMHLSNVSQLLYCCTCSEERWSIYFSIFCWESPVDISDCWELFWDLVCTIACLSANDEFFSLLQVAANANEITVFGWYVDLKCTFHHLGIKKVSFSFLLSGENSYFSMISKSSRFLLAPTTMTWSFFLQKMKKKQGFSTEQFSDA